LPPGAVRQPWEGDVASKYQTIAAPSPRAAFLGDGIRTVDAWFMLSPCGRDAHGLELIPGRLERVLPTGEPGTYFDWTVSPHTIERELPGAPVWRPEFEACSSTAPRRMPV
jgi:hypothetical protein